MRLIKNLSREEAFSISVVQIFESPVNSHSAFLPKWILPTASQV